MSAIKRHAVCTIGLLGVATVLFGGDAALLGSIRQVRKDYFKDEWWMEGEGVMGS